MSLELSGTTPAIKGVAGSVSAPAITGDDVDTGISFPSANTIKFSTGGVERMSITDSGVVGAGGGKVLQTKYAVKNNGTSLSSATTPAEISSDLRVTITPTSGSSLMIVTAELYQGQTTAEITSYRMYKSSSTNMSSPSFVQSASTINTSQDGNLSLYTYSRFALPFTLRALELAGNTNERTYSPFWANTGGTSYLNSYSGGGYYGTCNITVMEVEL